MASNTVHRAPMGYHLGMPALRFGILAIGLLTAALFAPLRAMAAPITDAASAPLSFTQAVIPTATPVTTESQSTVTQEPPGYGLLPAAAAVFPGILVHGTGHLVAGDSEGGLALLRWEGLGAALFFGGVIPLGLSGASRQVVRPLYYLSIAGATLFAVTWFADVYGAATGGRPQAAPLGMRPIWGSEAGYVWIDDPQFEYDSFFRVAAPLHIGRLGLAPEAWISLATPHDMIRVEATWRISGPLSSTLLRDETSLDAVLAVSRWNFSPEGFRVWTTDLALRGRYDMFRLNRSLAGSFAEGELGWGLESFTYDVPHRSLEGDTAALLLARIGYGVRFGTPPVGHGEAVLYYDHRHDDWLGGSGFGGLGDGVLGHWGIEGRWFFTEHWGIAAEVGQGAAWMTRADLVYRGGMP